MTRARLLTAALFLTAAVAGLCAGPAWAQTASVTGIQGPASVAEPFRTDAWINNAEATGFTVHGSASGLGTVTVTSGGVDRTATVVNGKWEISGLAISDADRNDLVFQLLLVWTDSSGNDQLRIATFGIRLSGAVATYDAPSLAAGRAVAVTPSVDASGEPLHVRDPLYPDLYPYTLRSGRLPKGLAFDRRTGIIDGVPETPGQDVPAIVIETLSASGNRRDVTVDLPMVRGQRIDNFGYLAAPTGVFFHHTLLGNPPPALDPSLTVVRFPPDGPTGALSFASADTTVCTVDSAGALTLFAAGLCTITATAAETGDLLPEATARFHLDVRAPGVLLSVTPAADAVISGPMGGPFTPDRIAFSMRRTGDLRPLVLRFGAEVTAGDFLELRYPDGRPFTAADWHELSRVAESGTGGAAPVVAHVNAAANSLAPGVYTATVTFDDRDVRTDEDHALPVTRTVRLEVAPLDIRIEPVRAAIRAGGDARFRLVARRAFHQQVNVRVETIGRRGSSTSIGRRWVTFPRGDTQKVFSLSTGNEDAGSVTARILPGDGYRLAPSGSEAAVQVRGPDEHPTVRIRAADADGDGEPDPITEGEDAVFIVTADPAPLNDLRVHLGIAALGGDHGLGGGWRDVGGLRIPNVRGMELVIPADQWAVTHRVRTVDDNVDEPHGLLSAQVRCYLGSKCTPDFANDTAEVAVRDNDGSGPELRVSVTSPDTIVEGGSASVVLQTHPGTPVSSVRFRVTVDGGDVGARVRGRGPIPAGEQGLELSARLSRTGGYVFWIDTDDDDVAERPDYGRVTVTVLPGDGYQLGTGTHAARVTVRDDDGPPRQPHYVRLGGPEEGGPRLTVQWGEVPEATGYEVRWGEAGEPARQTARVNAPAFTTPALIPGVAHAFAVAACNEAGCGEPSPEVRGSVEGTPPTANAGPDLEAAPGETVTLQGKGSVNPHGKWWKMAHLWAQQEGPEVSLSDATKGDPTFTVPGDAAPGTVFAFALTVTDKDGESDTDTMMVTVSAPVATPPTAYAGEDLVAAPGETVKLQGIGSLNPHGRWWQMAHRWAQVSGPEVTFSLDATRQARFPGREAETFGDPEVTLPADAAPGAEIVLALTVTDRDGESDTDTVTVTVALPALPAVTVADARAEEGSGWIGFTLTLDGPAPRSGVSVAWSTTDGTATAGSDNDGGARTRHGRSVGRFRRDVAHILTGVHIGVRSSAERRLDYPDSSGDWFQ